MLSMQFLCTVIESWPAVFSPPLPRLPATTSSCHFSFPVAGDSFPKQLSHLLEFLSKLQRENGLEMGDNPWEKPPEAVVEKGLLAVSEYFRDLFAEGTTIRRNIKAVFVGHHGAGKTR